MQHILTCLLTRAVYAQVINAQMVMFRIVVAILNAVMAKKEVTAWKLSDWAVRQKT